MFCAYLCTSFCVDMCFWFLLVIYPWGELLGHMVTLCLTFWGTTKLSLKWLHHFTFPPEVYEGSNFSTSSPLFVIICLFHYLYFFWGGQKTPKVSKIICNIVFSHTLIFILHDYKEEGRIWVEGIFNFRSISELPHLSLILPGWKQCSTSVSKILWL